MYSDQMTTRSPPPYWLVVLLMRQSIERSGAGNGVLWLENYKDSLEQQSHSSKSVKQLSPWSHSPEASIFYKFWCSPQGKVPAYM